MVILLSYYEKLHEENRMLLLNNYFRLLQQAQLEVLLLGYDIIMFATSC